jgi:hypothetical protein
MEELLQPGVKGESETICYQYLFRPLLQQFLLPFVEVL